MPRRGLLPGAGVTAAGATVVAPPPMTIWPGLPPGIYTRFAGNGTGGAVTWFPTGRAHPKVAEFGSGGGGRVSDQLHRAAAVRESGGGDLSDFDSGQRGIV